MAKKFNANKMDALIGGLTKHNIQIQEEQEEEINVEIPEVEEVKPQQEATIQSEKKQTNAPQKGTVSKEEKSKTIHFCTVADAEKVEKIKAIADKEYLAIKDIVNVAFDMVIRKYEEKNGVVKIKSAKKGDANKVFEL